MKAWLALEDGLVFEGEGFGAEGEIYGEVVFNTSLTGYQEILTDPSYKGQIVTMTYPHIGNYGITSKDDEAAHPWVEGFIVRELSPVVSNYRSEESLHSFMKRYGKIGIQEIDTRKLVKHLRDFGAKKGIISTADGDYKRLVKKAQDSPSIVGVDLVKQVTCKKAYDFTEGLEKNFEWGDPAAGKKIRKVVAIDCGIKRNILRKLNQHGFQVRVVPASTSAKEILEMNPDGIFLSNGPGDPEAVPYVAETVGQLIGKKPIFGICLGHQMLGLAFGGKTTKLKFGHRGGNHPVMDLSTRRIEITAQNHGFEVQAASLPEDVEVTHTNLNDGGCEGLAHKKHPVFSVQYHPENAPGPHDSDYLFRRFAEMVEKNS